MVTVGLNTLRRNLSAVLKKVENGESISITSRGHEIALLVPPGSKIKISPVTFSCFLFRVIGEGDEI